MKPLIAVTMGDAAGIGPEVTVKALLTDEVQDMCRAVVIGNAGIMEKQCNEINTCSMGMPSVAVKRISELKEAGGSGNTIDVLDPTGTDLSSIEPGKAQGAKAQKACGRAAVEYVRKAV